MIREAVRWVRGRRIGVQAGSGSRRTRSVAGCLLVPVVFALCVGCAPERPRAILIGIDGASPQLVRPMIESGRLPVLARIGQEGVSGKLRSELPLFSPRIWNTIATGKAPTEHGVMAFVKKDDKEERHLYLSDDRKVPGLWNIFSAQGLSVGVVNWWTTYPPEKVSGVMVSDHFFPEQIEMIKRTFKDRGDSAGALIHPASFTQRAEAELQAQGLLTSLSDPFAGNEALSEWINRDTLSRQFTTDTDVTRVALAIQQEHDPDVMMVFLPGIDRVSHWLWGNLEPEELYPPSLQPTPQARVAGAEALRRYYEYTDALIGLLVEAYGPEDLVMIVSDHGFEAGVSMMRLTGKHDTPDALDGIIFARGNGIAPGQEAGEVGVYDVAPTLLAWFGLPIADDMSGRPADFVKTQPPRVIVSYDDIIVERLPSGSSGQEENIVEHLRALGYLEEDQAVGD